MSKKIAIHSYRGGTGKDVGELNLCFNDMIEQYNPDYLVIDTHPGLNEETLLSLAKQPDSVFARKLVALADSVS